MKKLHISLNELNALLTETVKRSLLKEIASPIVWHWTTDDALYYILKDDEFELSCADDGMHLQNKKLVGYTENRPYYFSTTRSKSSHDGYSTTIKSRSEHAAVRIQIDGAKLSQRLHAKAGLYHSNKEDSMSIKGRYTRNFVDGYNKMSDIKLDQARSNNEKEDTFWSSSDVIENASQYIQRIDLLVYKMDEVVEDLVEKCEYMKIPCYVYDDEEAFNLQSHNYFDADRAFAKRCHDALLYYNNGGSVYTAFDNVNDNFESGNMLVELQDMYNVISEDGEYLLDEWTEDWSYAYDVALGHSLDFDDDDDTDDYEDDEDHEDEYVDFEEI